MQYTGFYQEENERTLLDTNIVHLHLSYRALRCLHDAGLHTIGDILEADERYLLSLRGFGKVCLAELHQTIDKYLLERQQFSPLV